MSEEEFNGIRCDICKREFRFTPGQIVSGSYAVPVDWFMLDHGQYGRPLAPRSPIILCSRRCLASWANKNPLAVEDLIRRAEDVPHEPYPYCCAEHYPLPERRKP